MGSRSSDSHPLSPAAGVITVRTVGSDGGATSVASINASAPVRFRERCRAPRGSIRAAASTDAASRVFHHQLSASVVGPSGPCAIQARRRSQGQCLFWRRFSPRLSGCLAATQRSCAFVYLQALPTCCDQGFDGASAVATRRLTPRCSGQHPGIRPGVAAELIRR